MIVPTYTISDPKTVMVVSLYTYLTFIAMFSSVVGLILAYFAEIF